MRKIIAYILFAAMLFLFSGCNSPEYAQVAATTATVYEFAQRLCSGTDISVAQLITENVSCLHDYTLQTKQMRLIENAEAVLISGAGLETFLDDVLVGATKIIDASTGISLICHENAHAHHHENNGHSHENDSHIWLSPANARIMVQNIYDGLVVLYPQSEAILADNLGALLADIDALEQYAHETLQSLSTREIITFHDGFGYMAEAFDLQILHAIEEESGSEASAAELIEIAQLIMQHNLRCIFTESNGSTSAAQIISAETNTHVYELDMAMSQRDYFAAMYYNIDTLKEALE